MVMLLLEKQDATDLELIQCGWEACAPGHSYGPAIRSFYLLHFIKSGHGRFESEGKVYPLGPGDGFFIFPGQMTYYCADKDDPWEYTWIGFLGALAPPLIARCGLSAQQPIVHDDLDGSLCSSFIRMEASVAHSSKELLILSSLYEIFGVLSEQQNSALSKDRESNRDYAAAAIEMIYRNYGESITVEGIADALGLNRSYFYQVFHQKTGSSPQEFLIETRMTAACELLRSTDMAINRIARSVGYENPFMFSRIFKKRIGYSPSKFRAFPVVPDSKR